MRNIILFIRRFFILFIFVVLQILSIAILVKYNRTYEAAFANNANEVIGSIDKQYNKVHEYFTLKKTNEQLAQQNEELLNLLKSEYGGADTASFYKTDSLLRDTLGRVQRFHFLKARVVNNSVGEENNFITISRGAKQGVKKDMGVMGPNGVVGRVMLVSDNYSIVMSLLNRNSKISARLKNDTSSNSSVDWDGKDPYFITLHNVSKSAKVKRGDTAVTSNFSTTFPQGLIVGTVYDIATDPSSNFYVVRLKTTTNFYNLQYVYLIENTQWAEQHSIEAQIPKNDR
jgi:rod shape-determining protein MreC